MSKHSHIQGDFQKLPGNSSSPETSAKHSFCNAKNMVSHGLDAEFAVYCFLVSCSKNLFSAYKGSIFCLFSLVRLHLLKPIRNKKRNFCKKKRNFRVVTSNWYLTTSHCFSRRLLIIYTLITRSVLLGYQLESS